MNWLPSPSITIRPERTLRTYLTLWVVRPFFMRTSNYAIHHHYTFCAELPIERQGAQRVSTEPLPLLLRQPLSLALVRQCHRKLPTVLIEFGPVIFTPLLNESRNSRWQTTFYNLTHINCNHCPETAIFRMKMRRVVIVVKHGYHDAKESANVRKMFLAVYLP